jgi:hypothetical protein
VGRGKKEVPETPVRTAEQPGQAVNIDLCFVPERHTAQEKLPAVSGSSGHLVVERQSAAEERPKWPGQVFGEEDLSFEEAMQQYGQRTVDRHVHKHRRKETVLGENTHWRKEWESREERHAVWQRRKQEDIEWQAAKTQRIQALQAYRQLPKPRSKEQKETKCAEQAAWVSVREQYHLRMKARLEENLAWHERIQQRHGDSRPTPADRSWIAVLMMTDNCTRQCLALPLFQSGAHVTGQEVIDALRTILPAELQFMISDQGLHFRNKFMDQLAQEEDFMHVLVYRHRPESNGIAERFVLTFKDWLRSSSWNTLSELEVLVQRFRPEYNDRPHQGLAIPGLSPNEYAKRIWLM